MSPDLDAALCKKYPHVFFDRNASMRTTAMCWGFECGDGWYKIIDRAAAKLEALIIDEIAKDSKAWEAGYYRASQVKEKYGVLCFYLLGGTDKMYAITDNAERQSEKTCERCGKKGKLRGIGWLYTACLKHTRKEDR